MWHKIKALRVLLPKHMTWQKTLLGCGMMLLVAVAFCCGNWWGMSQTARAQQPSPGQKLLAVRPTLVGMSSPDDGRAPVAYIFGQIPVTRQDLGEYLIARFGPERLDFLVNRKIIEIVCANKGISVTDAEVEAQLVEDLKAMNVVKVEDFVNVILKRFGKTLYEYQEDVVRPKIAMNRLFQNDVKVSEQEVKDAFEAQYGPKVKCRLIIFDKDQSERTVGEIWQKVKADEAEFKRYAKQNPGPLGASGGEIPPIHKHFPDKRIEQEAFALKPGEVTSFFKMPDGSSVILKCDELIPALTNHKLEDEWQRLHTEVYEHKLAAAIPKAFQELRKQADPKMFLQREETNRQATQRINLVLMKAAAERAKLNPMPPLPPGIKAE